ncbi:probable proteasome assembly chaperone 2 [Coccomyxa sp. Obi]|nr:probable proteasome assembly chaperone 2 [Coccomyxa sp. Obi]
MEIKYESCSASVHNKTLLLPAEGIGNVGQLAVDLIIHNASLCCIASLRDPHNVLPCIGSDPYGASGSTTSSELQLYGKPNYDNVVLQQRGCTAIGRQSRYAESLADFVLESGFDKVIMLGSTRAAEGGNGFQHPAPRFKCSCPEAFNVEATSWHELEDKDPVTGIRYVDQHLSPFAFFCAAQARGLQVCLVLLPVDDEGDNSQDAKMLASAATQLLEHPYQGNHTSWLAPPSWIVFGQQRVAY